MNFKDLRPPDLLVQCYKFYCRKDALAHDALLYMIGENQMPQAVLGCIDEALKQEDPSRQSLYINGACFGMKNYPGVAIEEFNYANRRLRVMNICRSLGLDPQLSIDQITDQLIMRRKFKLALWIVEWMRDEGEAKVRGKWCEHVIGTRTLTDFQAAEKIQEILGSYPAIPYAEAASIAIEQNRVQLAIALIENEAQYSKQIPLLMKLRKYDLVLAQALASCDANSIYSTIFKLRDTMMSEIAFLDLLKKHKLALNYYCNYLSVADMEKLILICHKNSPEDELIYSLVDNQYKSALTVSRKVRRDIIPTHIEAALRLGKFHESLDRLGAPPLAKQAYWKGLSISDTIINLISMGKVVMAKDCQRKFEISEKKYKALEQIALNTLPKLQIPTTNP